MKTIITQLFAIAISLAVSGQSVVNYQFAASAGSYTSLSAGISVPFSGGNSDDGWFNAIPIGFTFYYMGTAHTTVSVSTKGWMTFGQNVINAAYNNLLASGGARPLVAPLWDDHDIQLYTNFSYQTEGTAPNRVFTGQWNNVKWRNLASAAGISFQVKLHEASARVEFVYHPEAGALYSPTASIGITAAGTGANNFLSLGNATASPPVSSSTETTGISTKPADGQVYSFSPPYESPDSPSALNFTDITKTSLKIQWTDQSDSETFFTIAFSPDGVTYTRLGVVTSSTMLSTGTVYSLDHTGLLPGVTHYYRVTACNEGSAPSSPLSGCQSTQAPVEIISVASGNWNAPGTWSTGSVPGSLDNVTIDDGDTVVVNATADCNALTVGQGTTGILRFGTTAQTMTVVQGVTVNTGATFVAGVAGGTNLTHNLKIGGSSATATGIGNLTVNGNFDMYIGSGNGKCTVSFFGNRDAAISGTGTIDFYRVVLNKGEIAPTAGIMPPALELLKGCSGSGVATTGFIYTHSAGTLKIGGTFTYESKIYTTASYSIPDLGAFWVSNPNFTVAGQSGNPVINGLFRITDGTCFLGSSSNNTPSTPTGAMILVEGGTLNFPGRFFSSNAITWSQSGGTVNATTVGNTGANLAGFGLSNVASSFIMSGGTIVLVLPNTNTTPASRIDYFNSAGTIDITGGTLQLGTTGSGTTRTYVIKGATPNLEMSNIGGNSSVTLTGNLTVYGDMNLSGTGNFNAASYQINMKGMNLFHPGNIMINPGSTLTMNNAATAILAFTGIHGHQTLTSSGTLAANQLGGIIAGNGFGGAGTVTVPGGLTLLGDGVLNLALGTLQTGSGITAGTGGTTGFNYIRGDGQLSGTLNRNFGTGQVNYTYNGTSAQATGSELPATITGMLTIANPAGVTLSNALNTGKLQFTSGILYTGSVNLLTITGSNPADLLYTTGQINGPLKRTLPAGLTAGTTWLFPLGKALYRPLELVDPVTGAGAVTVTAEVFDEAAGGTPGATMVSLDNDRYWVATISSGNEYFTRTAVRITEEGLTTNSGIARCDTKTGVYELASLTIPVDNKLITGNLTSPGYFVTGDKKMNFVSAATTQTNVTYVREGSADQEIIGIRVVTSGSLEPAEITSLTFTTNGTTRTADIAAAKVYYTGLSSTFALTNPFGTPFTTPSGIFTITGSQSLAEGTNYFWLVYDVAMGVVDNDLLDAECNSLTVRGVAYVPDPVAPAGSRTVKEALTGALTVGLTGTWPNLTGTGGLFEKIAAVGLKGNVEAVILSDIAEPSTQGLGPWTEAGGTGFSLTIRPDAATLRTLSGNVNQGLIRLLNADRVTIDGRFNGSGKYLALVNQAATGSISAVHLAGANPGQGCEDITIRNCRLSTGYSGSTSYAVSIGGTYPGAMGYDNDRVSVIDCNMSKAGYGIFAEGQSTGKYDHMILSGDSIGSTVIGNEITHQGIRLRYCDSARIAANQIFNIVSVNASKGLYAIYCHGISICGNKISNVKYTGTSYTGSCEGISLYNLYDATCGAELVNNVITGISGIGSLALSGIAGIRITNGKQFTILYNSVYLSGDISNTTTNTISAAFDVTAQGGVTLKNNILVNSIVNTSAYAVAYAIYSNMHRINYTEIDYNIYFASGSQARLGYSNGTPFSTMAEWRAATQQDAHSKAEDPVFAGLTDLHIDLSSPARFAASPVPEIDTDYEGVARHPVTPNIGAYETATDLRGPFITYTGLGNTAGLTSRTLVATITDSTGVPAAGDGLPVLYWNINRGAWSSATALFLGDDHYQFTFGDGVAVLDSVFYFIAAQDVQAPPYVSVWPSAGATGFTANPPACAIKPVSPSVYQVLPGLNGVITVGSGGQYANLTGSGGLFEALSTSLVTGDITATVISGLSEPGTFHLYPWAEEGTGNFTLTIVPEGTAERLITGNTSSALLTLNGVSRVTFDGGSGDTTTRRFRIRNENPAYPAVKFLNGAQYNVIRNCVIESGWAGIHLSTSTVYSGNSYNHFFNNEIREINGTSMIPVYGIYSNGTANNPNKHNTIEENLIHNFTNSGIYIGANGNGIEWMIRKNHIYYDHPVQPVTLLRGIYFTAGYFSFGNEISGNYIGGQAPLCGGNSWDIGSTNDFFGIYFEASWADNHITGNTITNIYQSDPGAGYFYGIFLRDCYAWITDNMIGHADPLNSIRNAASSAYMDGIRVQFPSSTCLISGNTIRNLTLTSPNGSADVTGIFSDNANITGNRISGIGNCLSPGMIPYIYGIYINSTGSNANEVANNSVSLDGGAATVANISGVYDYSGYEDVILFWHNSVSIAGPVAATPPSAGKPDAPGSYYYQTSALSRSSAGLFEMKNNSLANFRTGPSTVANYCFDMTDTLNLVSDYNDLYSAADTLILFYDTVVTSLTGWQGFSQKDLHSVSGDPRYTDNHNDLQPLDDSPLAGTGTRIELVSEDIDGNIRDTLAPTIGCYETAQQPDKTWNGSVSTDWSDPQNWTPAGVPSSADDVLIPAGTPNVCIISSPSRVCGQAMIASGASLTLTPAGGLTTYGKLTIQPSGTLNNQGTLDLKGNLINQN